MHHTLTREVDGMVQLYCDGHPETPSGSLRNAHSWLLFQERASEWVETRCRVSWIESEWDRQTKTLDRLHRQTDYCTIDSQTEYTHLLSDSQPLLSHTHTNCQTVQPDWHIDTSKWRDSHDWDIDSVLQIDRLPDWHTLTQTDQTLTARLGTLTGHYLTVQTSQGMIYTLVDWQYSPRQTDRDTGLNR